MRRQHRLTAKLGSLAAAVAVAGTITLAGAATSVPAQAQTPVRAAAALTHHAAAPANCPVITPAARSARPQAPTTTPAAEGICPGQNPPCYGKTCVGKDPHLLGCDKDARPLTTLTAPGGGGTVELRWSDWCAANWAKINVISWPHYVQTLDGQKEFGSPWTLMVDGTQLAKACLPAYSGSSYGPWYCTAWY